MRKTQFAAFLMSGLLVLNTAIPAFAEGMAEQTAETYKIDTTAPVVTAVSVNKNEVKAPGTITATLQVEEENGLEEVWVFFKNKETERIITGFSQNNLNGDSLSVDLNVSEYETEGLFELSEIQIEDKAGNRRTYSKNGVGEELPKPVPSFTVINDTGKIDVTAPKVTSISVNKQEVKAPGTVTATLQVEEENGLEEVWVFFKNKETERIITGFSQNNLNGDSLSVDLNVSEYETEGLFELSEIQIEDKAGNRRTYSKNGVGEELPKPIPSFTVINDDELVPGQSENRPSKPERPSKPNNSGSSSGGIVNYDSEKPDPADKKATEMYNFWQNVKRKIKNTEEGKTLRVAVPAEYTYMPASVMETLRLNPEVSLKLSWGKDTVVIKAGTAQPKQKLKAYWTKSALLKLYPQK